MTYTYYHSPVYVDMMTKRIVCFCRWMDIIHTFLFTVIQLINTFFLLFIIVVVVLIIIVVYRWILHQRSIWIFNVVVRICHAHSKFIRPSPIIVSVFVIHTCTIVWTDCFIIRSYKYKRMSFYRSNSIWALMLYLEKWIRVRR